MQEYNNANVPTSLHTPAMQFKENIKNHLNEVNPEYTGRKKTFMKAKPNERKNRDAMMSLFGFDDAIVLNCIEKLLSEEISYSELASLSSKDMELFGLSNTKKREELLKRFAELPNQDDTYESICNARHAEFYNKEIFNKAATHLTIMRLALSSSNYKLQYMPPADDIIGEKSFASRFVLEALKELDSVTGEVDKDIMELEELLVAKQSDKTAEKRDSDIVKKNTNFNKYNWILISSLLSGTLAAFWFWKFNRSH